LTLPLILKVALSDKWLNQDKILFHHTYVKIAQKIPFDDLDHSHSLHGAVLVHSVHLSCCKMQCLLVLGIPISWEHCLTDFFGNCMMAYSTLATLSLLVELQGLPDWSFLTFCAVP
jgi:hypothetical protein